MSRKIVIVAIISALVIGIVSVYSTFALNEDNIDLNTSNADYNLIYSIKEGSDKKTTVNANETKYVNVTLTNAYKSTIKYGMYYYLVSPKKMPNDVSISLSPDSEDALQNIIKPKARRSISIKITNNSGYPVSLIIGALVGFENGNIEDLVTNGEVLIK